VFYSLYYYIAIFTIDCTQMYALSLQRTTRYREDSQITNLTDYGTWGIFYVHYYDIISIHQNCGILL